jgi:hypothetical protein
MFGYDLPSLGQQLVDPLNQFSGSLDSLLAPPKRAFSGSEYSMSTAHFLDNLETRVMLIEGRLRYLRLVHRLRPAQQLR